MIFLGIAVVGFGGWTFFVVMRQRRKSAIEEEARQARDQFHKAHREWEQAIAEFRLSVAVLVESGWGHHDLMDDIVGAVVRNSPIEQRDWEHQANQTWKRVSAIRAWSVAIDSLGSAISFAMYSHQNGGEKIHPKNVPWELLILGETKTSLGWSLLEVGALDGVLSKLCDRVRRRADDYFLQHAINPDSTQKQITKDWLAEVPDWREMNDMWRPGYHRWGEALK